MPGRAVVDAGGVEDVEPTYRSLKEDEMTREQDTEQRTVISFIEDKVKVTVEFVKNPEKEPSNWDPNDFVVEVREV